MLRIRCLVDEGSGTVLDKTAFVLHFGIVFTNVNMIYLGVHFVERIDNRCSSGNANELKRLICVVRLDDVAAMASPRGSIVIDLSAMLRRTGPCPRTTDCYRMCGWPLGPSKPHGPSEALPSLPGRLVERNKLP